MSDDEQFSRLLDEFDSAYRANDLHDFWSRRDCSQEMRERVEKAHSGLQKLDSYFNHQTVVDDSQAAQALQLSSWFDKPLSLDRFQIIREIGRGGFGIVYLAKDPRLNRQVAIKIPRIENVGKHSLQNRFIQEAEIAASLDHPNIVPVFEVGAAGNVEHNIYIVSLFCPGEPLSRWLEQNPGVLNSQQKLALLICVCDAMTYCHRRGILHRDIKPSNILLFPEQYGNLPFVPRITDFGLAKAQESAIAETATSAMLGTPLYMAPEQASSQFDKISPATDVYAIGVLFYELLTGRPPFQGTMAEILDKVRHDSPQPLRQIDKSISVDLETICLKCLAKAPQDRYQDAGELLDDLLAFASGKPIQGRRPSLPLRFLRWSRKSSTNSKLVWLVTLCSIAVVALIVYSQLSSRLNQSQSEQINSQQSVGIGDLQGAHDKYASDLRKAHALWQFGKTQESRSLLESLSKRSTDSSQRNFAWHFLHDRTHHQKQDYVGLPSKLLCADFSPDMRWIVGADRKGNVSIWETRNTRPIQNINYSDKEVCDVAFSPNGRMLATTGQDSMIHVWSCETWEELMVFREPGGTNTALDWSPDSSYIISGSRAKRVSIWSLETEERVAKLEPVQDVVRNVAWSPDGRYVAANIAGKVAVWSVADWSLHCQHAFHYDEEDEDDSLYALSFTAKSDRLLSGGKSKRLHVIELLHPERAPRSVNARDEPFSFAEAPKNRLMVSGLYRGGPRIWSSDTLGEIVTIEESHSTIRSVQISMDERRLLSASEDNSQITLWDLTSIVGYEVVASGPQILAQRSNAQNAVYASNNEQETIVYRTNDPSHALQLPGASSVANFDQGANLLARSTGSAIEIWNVEKSTLVSKLDLPAHPIFELAFSPDTKLLMAHSERGDWTLYNLNQRQCIAQFASESSDFPTHTFSYDGHSFVAYRKRSSVQDCRLEIRSTADGSLVQSVLDTNFTESIATNLAFTQLYLAQDSGITVYDLKSNTSDSTHFRRRQGIERIAISPDDKILAAWIKDEGIFLWDVQSGQELFPILLTSEFVDQLEFTSNSVLQCRTSQDSSYRLLSFKVSDDHP